MIFSATVPGFIQELAAKKLKNPLLIDLVGDDTTQVPERIKQFAVVVQNQHAILGHIQSYIEQNRDKKIIIFTETKHSAKAFEEYKYARKLTLNH